MKFEIDATALISGVLPDYTGSGEPDDQVRAKKQAALEQLFLHPQPEDI